MTEIGNIKEFLDEKADRYNHPNFIESDPIQIPHQYSEKNDVEISAFLASAIAWGQRVTIIKNLQKLMALMDHAPYDFVMNHSENDLERLSYFKHRTFNGEDCKFFIKSLKNIYLNHSSIGDLVQNIFLEKKDVFEVLSGLRKVFLKLNIPQEHKSIFLMC